MTKRQRKDKWFVEGAYGNSFANLKSACQCAKENSKTPEYNFRCLVWLLDDGCNYFTFEHGKCTRDGWTIK